MKANEIAGVMNTGLLSGSIDGKADIDVVPIDQHDTTDYGDPSGLLREIESGSVKIVRVVVEKKAE